jgi:hypothetical protein
VIEVDAEGTVAEIGGSILDEDVRTMSVHELWEFWQNIEKLRKV